MRYIVAVECGTFIVDKKSVKFGNEAFHHYCTNFVNSGSYDDDDKSAMKREIDLLKTSLDAHVGQHYKN